MKRWIIVFVVMLLAAILSLAIIFQHNAEQDKTSSGLPYGPPPEIPESTALAPEAVDVNAEHHFPSLTYGIHAFLWWDSLSRGHMLDTVNIMQFSHVRQSFAWRDIEPEPRDRDLPSEERYFWQEADLMMADIEAKGVKVLARVDAAPDWAIHDDVKYGDVPFDLTRFGEVCSAIATRFQGRIDAYQIWNEPNLAREWGGYAPDPAAYATLLQTCATAIREVDPTAIIVSAGISPTGTRTHEAMPDDEYLWRLYQVDGFRDSFDVLGLHAPGWHLPPETSPEEAIEQGYLAWQTFRHVERMRALMVASDDATRQVAITEMGWTMDSRPDSIYSWMAVTPEQQADYLARAYAYAAENWRPWVGLMVTIYLPDPAWTEADEQWWWAIGTPAPPPWLMDTRPAYAALVEMRKISSEPAYDHPARDESGDPIPEEGS